MRLWVEINHLFHLLELLSCQPPCEAVSWNIDCINRQPTVFVSLLVRLWVEIFQKVRLPFHIRSASLWGCELKCWLLRNCRILSGQPPCEAVSWNIKWDFEKADIPGQPPCEAVSWNILLFPVIYRDLSQPPCEAVSWNKKYEYERDKDGVSLLVRLWVEIQTVTSSQLLLSGQPPCEAVSWNSYSFSQ